MNATQENEAQIYYIECVTQAATRIGRRTISPNMPPTEFTEREFQANLSFIEFYEKQGIIVVTRPGTTDSILKADEIKREQERLADIFAGETPDEPDPVLRKRGHSVPEEYARKMASSRRRGRTEASKFTAPAAPITPSPKRASVEKDDRQCVAISKNTEKRCKRKVKVNHIVCVVHYRVASDGREVFDIDGRKIAKDGKTFVTE
jgi:hypothetical protein